MEERFLYHIWDAGHVQAELRTVSGKDLKIHYPGQFNTNRGPDFVNAVLSIGNEELQGAVEIHLNSQDWRYHNHQEDHFFNSVILHVVYQHNTSDQFTVKENGELCEILELQHFLSEDIDKLLSVMAAASSEPRDSYCELLSAIDLNHLQAILHWNGRQRLQGKVRRFNAQLSMSDFDQLLYEGIMEAAGYDKNKLNFLALAQQITFSKLREWHQYGMQSNEMTGILSVSSGLLGKATHLVPEKVHESLMKAYERQPWQGRNIPIDWQLFRIRPANHPLKRLLAISYFAYQHLGTGLLNTFLDQIERLKPHPAARIRMFKKLFDHNMADEDGSSWALGMSVINNIYLNIYLPILLLFAQKTADQALQDSLLASWDSQPALADNHVLRFMVKHLNPSQIKAVKSKSSYQQGLLHIFHQYCNYHLCEQCRSGLC